MIDTVADLSVQRFPGRDGLELTYREVGEGRPVLLLHGFTASGSQWIRFGPAATLAKQGYRVILPDLRGHGDSGRPHGRDFYPPDVLAHDGLALLDWLGLEGYELGGYSLGARIVVRMLAQGARPARAIVAAQGLAAITRPTDGVHHRRVLTALVRGEVLEPGSPEAEQAAWVTRLGGDPLALLRVLDTHVPTPVAELARIMTPTLVVVGDRDDGHTSADALAATLPNGRLVRVPGDHFTALASPEFAAAVSTFLATPLP